MDNLSIEERLHRVRMVCEQHGWTCSVTGPHWQGGYIITVYEPMKDFVLGLKLFEFYNLDLLEKFIKTIALD